METNIISELTTFIEHAPTAFHAVAELKEILKQEGFEELKESEKWKIKPGKRYYVTRNNSSIIAVKAGKELDNYSFHVTASHSDSPAFKLKENAEIEVAKKYTVLNTEGYGGMICQTWFDRPLSLAGRVMVKNGERIETRLVKVDRDLLMIPSLAIHMDRKVNEGRAVNKQIDMLPILSGSVKKQGEVRSLVAEELGLKDTDIYGMDLFLYNRMGAVRWGSNREFIGCPRLDDLQCAFTSMKGFLAAENNQNINIYACFDNEEVGSGTKQGADSTFLKDVLERINDSLGRTREQYLMAVASSFMISADNAHAVHPNHADVADPTNRPAINEGIVIKYNANQKYTTDAVSAAVFKALCKKVQVPVQTFTNRSDIAGGSTLGNISNAHVSLNTVDIGLPQFAMHSPYETAGVKDTCYLIKAATEFFNSCIVAEGNGNYSLGE